MNDIGKKVIETGEDIFDPWGDFSFKPIKERVLGVIGAAVTIGGGILAYEGESFGYAVAIGGALILYKDIKRHRKVRKYSEND